MPTEMKSPPSRNEDARDADELDAHSLAAIRSLFEEEQAEEAAAVTSGPKGETASSDVQVVEPAQTDATYREPVTADVPVQPTRRDSPPVPTPETIRTTEAPQPARPTGNAGSGVGRLLEPITSYRPTPKHIALGALALLVLFRPWLVVGVIVISGFVMLCTFLILGYDGFWERAIAFGRWYARRSPDRAARLHRKLDDIALRWDTFLDRFPEGWVDGLYLPDFGELATADARHDAVLDKRLSEMREGKV